MQMTDRVATIYGLQGTYIVKLTYTYFSIGGLTCRNGFVSQIQSPLPYYGIIVAEMYCVENGIYRVYRNSQLIYRVALWQGIGF